MAALPPPLTNVDERTASVPAWSYLDDNDNDDDDDDDDDDDNDNIRLDPYPGERGP